MSVMTTIFTHFPFVGPLVHAYIPRFPTLSNSFNVCNPIFSPKRNLLYSTHFSKLSSFSTRSFQPKDAGNDDAPIYNDTFNGGIKENEELFVGQQNKEKGASFLAKLAIGLGIAATVTFLCIGLKQQNLGPSFGIEIQRLADISSSSNLVSSHVGFSFKAFGYRVVLPQYAPGWIYFWLLIAAGCGLFISEEALNIWVCPFGWSA